MNADTLPALFRQQSHQLGPRVAVRFKQDGLYRDLTWQDFREHAYACASALVQHGIQPGDRVAILSENRVEWLIADMAIQAAGAVNVPLHAPLGPKQIQFQLDNSGTRWIFVSSAAQLAKLEQVRGELPSLVGVVLFDSAPWDRIPILSEVSERKLQGQRPVEQDPVSDDRIGILSHGALSWRGFLQSGRMAPPSVRDERMRREAHLTANDLATIIYTSGTTGNPKGVMLTQRNLLSNALAFRGVCGCGPDSVMLNWLPFSHIYARTVDIYVPLAVGATLCLAESPETVVANLAEIQPTNMSSVPRFYEKVLAAVADADPKIVAKRLHAIFGPRIVFLGSGGAPLPVAVAQAYRDAGFLLLQGYGLTESSPVIAFNRVDCHKIETVGQAIPGVEVRIGDDGEVLSRGPHIMAGYWKNPVATANAIVDGWLHTGDLGHVDSDGFLTINGRKKDLLVLSNGKKVVPTHVEGILVSDPCIDQAIVCGEGRNYLVALVVPNPANLARAMSLSSEPDPRDPAVRAFLEARVASLLEQEAAWEQVRKIVVLAEPFSITRDEMTVSLKLRRNVIVDHHCDKLDALYREG